MMIEPQFLIIGGVAAVVGVLALVSRAQQRRRRAAYEEFSLVRGFRFEPERPEGERRFRDVFESFNEGRRRTWGYTISGTKNQAPFIAFEYQWVTGGGKNSSAHRLSGIVWERDDISFPKFALSPEGWFSRLGEIFGMQDIDFPESPDFSKAYRLKGPDEPAIRQLFTPEIRRFFEASPDQHVAGGGRFLFWWRGRRLPSAGELDEWLEQGDHVRRRFFKS
jgi:hypothetical protein